MPFKSQAQRRKFAQLLVEGKISPQTFEEWNRETGNKRLPDHVKRKAKRTTMKRKRRRSGERDRAGGRSGSVTQWLLHLCLVRATAQAFASAPLGRWSMDMP